jgi:transcriptional regulator with XRE-family HTH domain
MQFDDERVRQYLGDHRKACGERLAHWRQTRRLTQEQLAEIAGVTQQMISFAELGLRVPRLDARMKICAALAAEHDDIWPAPDRVTFARRTVAA